MNAAKLFSLILFSSFGVCEASSVSDSMTTNYLSIGVSMGLLAIVSLAPAVYYLKHDPPRIVSPISLQGLSFFSLGVLGGGLALRDPSYLIAGEAGLRFFPFATFLLTLGFLSFSLGYFLVPNRAANQVAVAQWKEDRIWPATLILIVAAWGARAYAMSQGLVVTKLINEPSISYVSNPILLAALQRSHVLIALAVSICVVAYARVYADRPAAVRKKWQAAALILLMLEGWHFAVVQLTRFQILGAWLGVFCILCLIRRPPWRQVLIFLVLFFTVLVPLVQTAKSALNEQRQLRTASADMGQLRMLVLAVFPAAIETLAKDYFSSFGDSMGHSTHWSSADLLVAIAEEQEERGTPPMGWEPIVAPVLQLVPRVIWPDKPLAFDLTRLIKGYYGYWDDADVAITLLAQLYASFGIPGIIIGMVPFGIFLRLLYRMLVERGGRNWNTGIVLYAALSLELVFGQGTIPWALAPLRDLFLLWIFLSVMLEGRLPFLER